MNVQNLPGNKITSSTISNSIQVLRPGQIIQGKILKLFPNQKAQIQLGPQRMIAQLEASLTVGGKYHFQVQPSDDVTHLRVIGEQLQKHGTGGVMELLQQLGVKASRTNAALLRTLVKEKIPFTKEQLLRASQLMTGGKSSQEAIQIIKGMISAELPISNSVYKALSAVNSGGMSEQIESLLFQLKKNPGYTGLQQNLSHQLSRLIEPASSPNLTQQITAEASRNQQQLFQVLKAVAAVESHVHFSNWKAEWLAFSEQGRNTSHMPFQLNSAITSRLLEGLQRNGTAIRNQSQTIMQQWASVMENAYANNQSLSHQDFLRLNKQLTKSLLPLMTTTQQQQISDLIQNNPVQIKQLLRTLQTLANRQTYRVANDLVPLLKMENHRLSSPSEQFLNQIRQVLQSMGLNYENQIATQRAYEQQNTVKAMLMQLIQQSDGTINERSQQLLNYMNGMQIQSVNESANVIQANLQVPGQKLGLPDDLQMAFSGNKTEDGTISPDSCRILFYLELGHLQETIIDMHIQRRAVSITIYNENQNLAEKSAALKPKLKDSLASLDYQLSAITFKPLNEKKQSVHQTVKSNYAKPFQGVDYRI